MMSDMMTKNVNDISDEINRQIIEDIKKEGKI